WIQVLFNDKTAEFFPNSLLTYYPVLSFTSENAGTGEINIFNLVGSKVMQYKIPVNSGLNFPVLLQLATLQPGSYILQFKWEKKAYHKKIVKM
ncbi:MAG: T9SS type A sorting domain-containing protein, partial [Bacteroidales bacterium]|nr:T9SS type A sorting domain-containing protein [Bacteroidales bacterium]